MAKDEEAEVANFVGWHFPEDPDFDYMLSIGAFCNTRFASHTLFFGATFSGNTGFSGAVFGGEAVFAHAMFEEHVWFMGAEFSKDACVSFENTVFKGHTFFVAAAFGGVSKFIDAEFGMAPWFIGAQFGRTAKFGGARFREGAAFRDAKFHKGAWFYGVTFSGDVAFTDAIFAEDTDFKSVQWSRSTNIEVNTPGFLRSASRPFCHRREGRHLYRIAKQAARDRGDYTEAGRYHYAEQCAIEDRRRNESGHRPWRRAFWFWLGRFLFGRVVFGYGEKPSHPLLLGLAVILACALVFGCIDGVVPDAKSAQNSLVWWQYGYFSVVTFTTLGYGDYRPKEGWPQVLAGFEAALGAALLATFVVCLTRKYMR